MGIETLIEELNANLKALNDTLSNIDQPEDEDLRDGLTNEAKTLPKPKKAPAKKKTTRKKTPAKKPPAKRAAKKSSLNYDTDVKPQVLIAISTPEGREEVKELLATFDVAKAPDLDADDYVAFLKGVEDIIEKYEDE